MKELKEMLNETVGVIEKNIALSAKGGSAAGGKPQIGIILGAGLSLSIK